MHDISIHAPRVGSDDAGTSTSGKANKFQSTLPVWGATETLRLAVKRKIISIHAPRVGSDYPDVQLEHRRKDFNPRSPCGERRNPQCRLRWSICYFNPRSPCGERQKRVVAFVDADDISIHAPRVGSDVFCLQARQEKGSISIHAPRVGSDLPSRHNQGHETISIHAPRVGSDGHRRCRAH